MKNTLVIAFNAGAYGTYLEWALNTLISTEPIHDPFTELGNSHNSKFGHHLVNMENFDRYMQSDDVYLTGRLHPKTKKTEKISVNLDKILSEVDRLILLYPDRSHYLMCVCNYMTKVWTTHYYDGGMSYQDPQDILTNWQLDPETDIKDIPPWIMREHMSFSLFTSWEDQVEWYFPDVWQHPRTKIITTKELFDDFGTVLQQTIDFWGVKSIKNIADLWPYHKKMLSIQPHIGKDQLCEDIVNSVLENRNPWHWGDLCIISQAWIQHQLRIKGYEIRCHNLNDFPQDTDHLRSLIYPVEDRNL